LAKAGKGYKTGVCKMNDIVGRMGEGLVSPRRNEGDAGAGNDHLDTAELCQHDNGEEHLTLGALPSTSVGICGINASSR